MPDTRSAITHKFAVRGHKYYVTVGLYEDNRPAELFITQAEGDPTIRGLLDCFAMSISISLQYGMPIEALVKQFVGRRFEPNGPTSNKKIENAESIVDYIFCWLRQEFVSGSRKNGPDHNPRRRSILNAIDEIGQPRRG
ncbi:MAG: hypothetical protein P4L61_03075 [Candidatus Pacebacteria bacterium]|nr:hypothetical protein [Candidatus Paceibacterota bacterium]